MPSPQHHGDPAHAGTDVTAALETVVARAVDPMGLDVESLEVRPVGRGHLVTVVVDRDDGVALDLVAEASRSVSAALDARDDLFSGPYTLEVTSPGVDRPLTRPRHWYRARLRLARVRRLDGTEVVGRVGSADEQGVELLVDGALRRVEYRAVATAAVEIEFRPPPEADLRLLDRPGDGAEHRAQAQKEEPK